MSVLKCMGYIGVQSDRFADWEDFAVNTLGMQLNRRTDNYLSFRMD